MNNFTTHGSEEKAPYFMQKKKERKNGCNQDTTQVGWNMLLPFKNLQPSLLVTIREGKEKKRKEKKRKENRDS